MCNLRKPLFNLRFKLYTLYLTQLTGPAMPPICGENAGQHLYLDAGANTDTSATLSVVTTGTADERQGHCVQLWSV